MIERPDLCERDLPPNLRQKPSAAAAAAVAEQDAFELLAEIADLVREHANELAGAAVRGDRARVRLHSCQLSRAVRSALLTVNDIFTEAERKRETEAAP
jgi:hypothetical protein